MQYGGYGLLFIRVLIPNFPHPKTLPNSFKPQISLSSNKEGNDLESYKFIYRIDERIL